jgi:hypothetical protein
MAMTCAVSIRGCQNRVLKEHTKLETMIFEAETLPDGPVGTALAALAAFGVTETFAF